MVTNLKSEFQQQQNEEQNNFVAGKDEESMVTAQLADSTADAERRIAADQESVAACNEEIGNQQRANVASRRHLKTAQEQLADSEARTAQKNNEYKEQAASRAQDLSSYENGLTALRQASSASSAFLQQKKAMSLLQVEMSQAMRMQRAMTALSLKAKTSSVMRAVVAACQDSSFDKVRGMIDAMLKRLEEESAKEASEKMACDKDMLANENERADLTKELQRIASAIEKKTAEIEQLTAQNSDSEEEIASEEQRRQDETVTRQQQASANAALKEKLEATLAPLRASQEAVAKGAQGQESLTDLITDLITDAEGELKAVEEKEATEAAEFTASTEELEKNVKQLTRSIESNELARRETRQARSLDQESMDSTKGMARAAMNILDNGLMNRCVAAAFNPTEDYAARVEQRNEEIASLESARSILRGEIA